MKLYRHFDAEGRLLYVGIARDPVIRLVEHESVGAWSEEIATITIERFETKEEAREAEARAIIEENPIHNIRRPSQRKRVRCIKPKNQTLPRILLNAYYDEDLAVLEKRLRGISLTALEGASGVSRATLWRVRQGRGNPDIETVDAIWAGIEALDKAEQERAG